MSTQETPEQSPSSPATTQVTAPVEHANTHAAHQQATPAAETSNDAKPQQASSPAVDSGPQPGTQHDAEGDDGDADGPEPGNERLPDGSTAQAAVPGAPGTGKRKRRRRKKKPHGEAGVAGAPGTTGREGGGEGATAEDGSVQADAAPGTPGEEGAAARGPRPNDQTSDPRGPREGKRGRNRKDRGPRRAEGPGAPARERPPFNFGDVVFGKIVALTDDAIFVDLSGKANAIFDRLELTMPEEPANTPADPEEEEDAPGTIVVPKAVKIAAAKNAAAAAEAFAAEPATSVDAAPTEAAAVEDDLLTAPSAGVTDATAAEEGAAGEGATPPAADATAATEAAPAAAAPAAPDPPAFLPPVVLEIGANFVGVVHNDGARGGLVVLTRHPRRASRAKPMVLNAFKEKDNVSSPQSTVTGLITGVIRGGVEVDIEGLRAFAPGSHMDLRLGVDLHHKVGMRLSFVVTQYGKKGRDIVLSRRRMLESEAKATREAALAKLKIGGDVDGIVRSIVPFGAFIDVGGVEGLVPLQEMSHNRSDGPNDCFKVGETIKVKIVRLDEKGKIWLSRKACIEDPWAAVAAKYSVGTRHAGKIVRLQPFGVFVELEDGIDGLIHAADLSIKRFEHPSEIVNVGDPIDVVVASVDSSAHKIALHPAPTGAAADEPHQRVQLHKSLKVQVMLIDPGGLVVRVLGATGRHARGFIPAGATGTARGTELRKVFPVGKELEAKVIDLDPKRGEVKLSIKAMNEDTERNAYKAYQQQVKREAKFGTFGDLLAKKMGKD